MTAAVYSGSKNAFWRISKDNNTVINCTTASINPFFNSENEILNLLTKEIKLINHAEQLKKIYVFSAGASSTTLQNALAKTLKVFFKNSKIKVNNDLFGAALAACQNQKGIVCVLGSGSNCTYFDGKKPKQNNYGLGYILGDEGSANYLGKILLKNYLEQKLPKDLLQSFENNYQVDRALILEHLYKKPNAQNYLSSFLDFYTANKAHTFITQQLNLAFEKYFKTYLIPTLTTYPNENIHFVGTLAATFEKNIRTIAKKYAINITSITEEPINNLIKYYSK